MSYFVVNNTAGGRLDAPFYPTKRYPYMKGLKTEVKAGEKGKITYVVPFDGEFHAVSVSCSGYDIEDHWNLSVNGGLCCDEVYTKRLPEGISLMAFIPVAVGMLIEFEFINSGKDDKEVWINLQFLRDDLPDYGYTIVTKQKIRLYAYDYGSEDGDVFNVYQNGIMVAENYFNHVKQDGQGEPYVNYIPLSLINGKNEIVFEGVSAGTGSVLSAKFYVTDENGNVLYTEDQLPEISIPREGLANEQTGEYAKPLPTRSWVIIGNY